MSPDTLLPNRPPVDVDDGGVRVVTLGTPESAELCGALASETATRIVANLGERPMVASELAECVDTSIQNVQHHLGRLRGVGLVEVVDTWYSSRGAEMKVYAPTHERLVLAAEEGSAGPASSGERSPEEAESTGLLAVPDGD